MPFSIWSCDLTIALSMEESGPGIKAPWGWVTWSYGGLAGVRGLHSGPSPTALSLPLELLSLPLLNSEG